MSGRRIHRCSVVGLIKQCDLLCFDSHHISVPHTMYRKPTVSKWLSFSLLFDPCREAILRTAKTLVEDTKNLVSAAQSSQDVLASAAQSAVGSVSNLADNVKLGAIALGSDDSDAQVQIGVHFEFLSFNARLSQGVAHIFSAKCKLACFTMSGFCYSYSGIWD